MTQPPYRIVTERLVIRCWNPSDAPLALEAVNSSRDHLRPWMPWAEEEKTLAEEVELLRGFRGRFDLGQDFVYGVFERDESAVVGGSGLHTRVGEGAYEIGYWIRASRVGEGLATEVTAALTRVALGLCGADRVELRIEPANVASLRIPAKLGYREEARLKRRLPGGRDMVLFTLFADELGGTPAASAQVEAYDALGTRVL